MSKKYDVTQGNKLLEVNPGGAPCNVLAMLNKAGRKVAFIGKVGDDMFGRMLKARTVDQGIDMGALMMDEEVHTSCRTATEISPSTATPAQISC